ncbi:MAG: TRAP transporter large permease subunit [Chloroflexi bacterium]|nr:TRAP transporter large permease subunit [Chloroflexota bacterium]
MALSDALDRLTEVGYFLATVAFASTMLLGVFFRYALNNSLTWSDELAVILFAWATFLSVSTVYRHGKHVNIDFLVRTLPPVWQARAALLAEGLTGGYIIALLVSGIQALPVAALAHTDALKLPLTVPYLAIPTASMLMAIHWLRRNLGDAARGGSLAKLLIALGFLGLVYLPFGYYVAVVGWPRFVLLALALFGPMLVGVPVAFAMGVMATVHIAAFGNVEFHTGALQIFYGIEIVALLAVPLLILSGSLMHAAGIAKRMVDFAQVVVGRVRGGLGAANVVASLLFGDISGSSVSDTAAIGSIMIPEMKRRGYRAEFCAALQGAAGTLGMTAPISITLILYATAVNTSVSRMAAATIVPGLLVAASFMLVALLHAHRLGYPRERVPFRLVLPRTAAAMPGFLAAALILGGLLGGVFTPAEIGVILLTYVLLLSLVLYRTAQPRRVYRTVIEAGHVSGMMLFMVATSTFVGFVLAYDLFSFLLVDTVSQLTENRYVVLFVLNLIFVILGMVLEAAPLIFGFLPSFMPLLQHVGIDPVHWGVLFLINMSLGMLVPPVALNLFISTAIAGVRYEQAVRAAVPFMLILVVDMVLVAVFPQLPLFLPHVLFGHPIR